MNIPIEDAVTIAYVDVVHALSECKEAYSHLWDGTNFEDVEDLYEAINDLENAKATLEPHLQKAGPTEHSETMAEYMIRMGW